MPKENRRCGQAGWGVQQDRRTGTNGRKGTTCFPLPKGRCAYSNPRRELSTKNGRTAAKKLRARLGCESLLNMVRHLSVLALVGSFNHILVQALTKTGLTAEAASGPRASSGASAAGRPGSSERNVAGGPTLVSRDSDDGVSDDDVSDDGGDNMSLPDLAASDSEDEACDGDSKLVAMHVSSAAHANMGADTTPGLSLSNAATQIASPGEATSATATRALQALEEEIAAARQ